MNETKVYLLNAFSRSRQGGNTAGVVLKADELAETEMQKIAAQVGCSETAFVQGSSKADFKVAFLTPNQAVDLCGHATIAAFSLLAKKGIIQTKVYTQETKAGILQVECQADRTIYMEQNPPEFGAILERKEVAASLAINATELISELPIQIVSTGLHDIMIPVKSLEVLHKIKPRFDEIARISKAYGVVGYHLFTLETLCHATAHCRNFAPLYDIPEEAATGTSNGALACYLFHHGILKSCNATLVFEQGYSMQRPSEILCKLKAEKQQIRSVKVGGKALETGSMTVKLSGD